MARKRTHRTARGLALLLTVLALMAVFACMLFSTSRSVSLSGTAICEAGDKLLLFAEGDAGPYVAYAQGDGGFLVAAALGSEGGRIAWEAPVLKVAYRSGQILALLEEAIFFNVDPYTSLLEPGDPKIMSLMLSEVELFDCNSNGDIYAVMQDDPFILHLTRFDYSEWQRAFDSPIRLLQVTEGGQLWVCTEDGYFVGDSLDPESLSPVSGGTPSRILDEDIFLDNSGNLWRVSGQDARVVLENLPSQGLCCVDAEGAVYVDGAGQLSKRLWDGGDGGSCAVGGEPMALSENGVLYRDAGMLYYAAYDFATEPEETPTPTPKRSEEPSASPTAVPTPSITPSTSPTSAPTPSITPSASPTSAPTPSITPSASPTSAPTPSVAPSASPTSVPTPSVTPSTGPTPSLSPGPGPTPPEEMGRFDERDNIIYLTGETTLDELVQEFKAQEILVKKPDGEPVMGGLLKTGMKLCWGKHSSEEIVKYIVVWGDCDGTGKVDEHDMEQAQSILLHGKDSVEEPYFLAADWDEDGEVTTKDLLQLSAKIKKK